MRWALAWFCMGSGVAFLVGALLSFAMGGPAWPVLLILGAVSSLASLVLLLGIRRRESQPTK